MERSYETQQRMVTALESQTQSFADYLNFLKSREPPVAPARTPVPPAANLHVAPALFDLSGTPWLDRETLILPKTVVTVVTIMITTTMANFFTVCDLLGRFIVYLYSF